MTGRPAQDGVHGIRGALLVVARGAVAIVTGYLLLVLLSTFVQEFWLGGVSYRISSPGTLILAGIFTPLSGAIAGYVTAVIARRWLIAHALPICLAIAIETTFLYRTGRVDGPLWFEALAGATLSGAVLCGFWIWRRASRPIR